MQTGGHRLATEDHLTVMGRSVANSAADSGHIATPCGCLLLPNFHRGHVRVPVKKPYGATRVGWGACVIALCPAVDKTQK